MASISVMITSWIDSRMKVVLSTGKHQLHARRQAGAPARAPCALTASTVFSALAPGASWMAMPAAGMPLKRRSRRIVRRRPARRAPHRRSRTTAPSGWVFRMMSAELLGRLQPRLRGDRGVELLARRRGLRADLAGRDLDVLRLDRGWHVGRLQLDSCSACRDRARCASHTGRRTPDVAHAVHAADRVLHLGCDEVGDVDDCVAAALVVERHDHQEVGLRLGDRDALLLHLLRAGAAPPAAPCSAPAPGRCRDWCRARRWR